MTGRRMLVGAWALSAAAALIAVVFMSGGGRSLPDLGSSLDLDSIVGSPSGPVPTPLATVTTTSTPTPTSIPTPAATRSVRVQARPPVRVPAPPPADDDDDGGDDSNDGVEEPDDDD